MGAFLVPGCNLENFVFSSEEKSADGELHTLNVVFKLRLGIHFLRKSVKEQSISNLTFDILPKISVFAMLTWQSMHTHFTLCECLLSMLGFLFLKTSNRALEP